MCKLTILEGKKLLGCNFNNSLINHTNYNITLLGPSNISFLYKEKYTADNDLILLDMSSDIDLENLIKHYANSKVKIGVILSEVEVMHLTHLLGLNLDGYFLADMEVEEIVAGIKLIETGYTYVHPRLTTLLHKEYVRLSNTLKHRPKGLLTSREWQVLAEISKGHSNEKIAANLDISDKTVKNHVTSVLRKLNVNDRTNAMLLALKNGWM
ncbi:response regulator transcription factor [Oceanobacillus damuensis]|uniref:response regulator transcription factor n=1 Tax=Oceanobacillus damuensis TaxID=937928 RepID=UPI000836AA80|nr:response regulator transcription factor [Oceanobacillus damuensis]